MSRALERDVFKGLPLWHGRLTYCSFQADFLQFYTVCHGADFVVVVAALKLISCHMFCQKKKLKLVYLCKKLIKQKVLVGKQVVLSQKMYNWWVPIPL